MKFTIGFFWLFLLKSTVALNQVRIPQYRSNWCWAACIQMIDKYYNSTSSRQQCDIAQLYAPFTECDSAPCNSCFLASLDEFSINPCNKRIYLGSTSIDSNCEITLPAYCFEYTLNQIGVSSQEFSNTNAFISEATSCGTTLYGATHSKKLTTSNADWDHLKTQIDSGKPMIFTVDRTISSNPAGSGTHAILVTNLYLQGNNPSKKKVTYIDPWRHDRNLCTAGQITVSFASFINGNGSYLKCISKYVLDIQKQSSPTVVASTHSMIRNERNISNSKTEFWFRKNAIINELKGIDTLSNQSIKKISNNIKYVTVKYLSYDKMIDKNLPFKLANRISNQTYISAFSRDFFQDATFILTKKGLLYEIEAVEDFSYLEDILMMRDINTNKSFRIQEYIYIEYPPFQCKFYSFMYQGKKYLSPDTDYLYINYNDFPLKKGVAYDEKKLLKVLHEKTIQYNEEYIQKYGKGKYSG